MCGIIGIASNKSVSSAIINSLRKLEYRGYDSAGIATCLLYTSPSPRDAHESRMPSSA